MEFINILILKIVLMKFHKLDIMRESFSFSLHLVYKIKRLQLN